jgi:hypothetical protein
LLIQAKVGMDVDLNPELVALAKSVSMRGKDLNVTARTRLLRELPALDEMCASHVLIASRTDLTHLAAVICQYTLVLALPGKRSYNYLPNAMVASCMDSDAATSNKVKSTDISKQSSWCAGKYHFDALQLALAMQGHGII